MSEQDYSPNGSRLVEEYAQLRWKLLALHPKTKKPMGAAWQKSNGLTEQAAKKIVERGDPVGVQVGVVSGWLCCVDNDSEESIKLAPHFLPKTLSSGKGKVASHYVYYSEGLDYVKYSDLAGGEILCVKAAAHGQGHQFVVPPSVHPEKGPYEWIGGFDLSRIATVGKDQLAQSVKHLATAALIAAHLPERGRHWYSLSLAGFLLNNNVSKNVVIRLLRAAWLCKNAPDEGIADLMHNIESTEQRIAGGQDFMGGPTLDDIVPGLTKCLAKFLGLSPAKLSLGYKGRHVSPADDDNGRPPLKNYPLKGAGVIKMLADAITSEDHFARDAGDKLYRFSGGCYRQYAERYIRRRVKELLEAWEHSEKWSSHRANEVAEYIRADAPELWERPPSEEVNVVNGILNLDSGVLRDHEPGYLSPVQIPVSYDPSATCPAWDKFVAEVFPEDAQDLAFELAADLITPNRSAQKAILLLGEGSNGKSTYLRALTAFVGSTNASGASLHKLESDRFATARLIGKLANICPDLPSTHLTETSVFKAITGGDNLHAEYKYRESFEFAPHCRLVFSANHVPRSGDASHAFFRRWLVVPFDRTFEPADQVPREELDARLSNPDELSGVLNMALALLPRLRQEGFTESESMREAWEEFKAMTDPVSVWLENNTIAGANAWVTKSALIAAYNKSAEDAGRAGLTAQAFGRAIKRARPEVGEAQRTVSGRQVKCYTGIGLKTTGDDPPEGVSTTATTDTTDSTIVSYLEKHHINNAREEGEEPEVTNKENGSNGSNGSSGESLTPGQEQRYHKLVRQGMSPKWARRTILADNHPLGCECEVCG